MPLTHADFHDGFDALITAANVQAPLVENDPRMNVFTSYTPTVGARDLTFEVNQNCWLGPTLLNQLRYVCWHDEWAGSIAQRCVAITPRHVLMGEHGHEPEFQALTWMLNEGYYPGGGTVSRNVTRYTVGSVYNIERLQIREYEDNRALTACRVGYLDGDLPRQLICPLLVPSDINYSDANYLFTNTPLLRINQYEQACVHTLTNNPTNGAISISPPRLLSSLPAGVTQAEMNNRATLYREAVGGDSGSPLFYIVGRAGGLLKLYYAGSLSAQDRIASYVGEGPSAIASYAKITEACRILNERFAAQYNAPHYVPVTKVRPTYTPPPRPGF